MPVFRVEKTKDYTVMSNYWAVTGICAVLFCILWLFNNQTSNPSSIHDTSDGFSLHPLINQ